MSTNTPTPDTVARWAASVVEFARDSYIRTPRGKVRFGDIATPFQLEVLEGLAQYLADVAHGHQPEVNRHLIEATKGCGKDLLIGIALVWLLLFTTLPLLMQVAAVDEDNAGETTKTVKEFLWANPYLESQISVQAKQILCDRTDSKVEILAADVAGSHGARIQVLAINELSHVTKTEFVENLLDNANKTGALVLLAQNAGFTGSFAWNLRELYRTLPTCRFYHFAAPAPWLRPADLEEARNRSKLPGRYKRLFWGVWSTGVEGNAIDPVDLEAMVVLPGPLTYRKQCYGPYLSSLDLGLRHDFSALVTIGYDLPRQKLRLVNVQNWQPSDYPDRKIPLEVVEAAVLKEHETFGPLCLVYDPYQCDRMASTFREHGIRTMEWTYVPHNLDLVAKALLEVTRNRILELYPHDGLLRALMSLSVIERPAYFRLVAKRTQEFGHADVGFALAQMLPIALQSLEDLIEDAENPPDESLNFSRVFAG